MLALAPPVAAYYEIIHGVRIIVAIRMALRAIRRNLRARALGALLARVAIAHAQCVCYSIFDTCVDVPRSRAVGVARAQTGGMTAAQI